MGELSKAWLSNCSEMLILGTYWKTRFSMVSEQTCTGRSQNGPKRDKRLSLLISHIHHTCDYKQCCHVRNTAKQCRLGLFQDSDFPGYLKNQNLHQVEHCAFSEAIRLLQSVGCVRTKLQFRTVQQNQKSFPWTQD